MLARRSLRTLTTLGIALGAYVVTTAALAAFFPGNATTFAEAFVRWSWSLPLALAAWLALEWVGTKTLGLPFWQRMSAATRVALLVALVVAVVLLAIGVGSYLNG